MGAFPSLNLEACCLTREHMNDAEEIRFSAKESRFAYASQSLESRVVPRALDSPEVSTWTSACSSTSGGSERTGTSTASTDDSESMLATENTASVTEKSSAVVSKKNMFKNWTTLAYLFVLVALSFSIRYQVYSGIYMMMTVLFCWQVYDALKQVSNSPVKVVKTLKKPRSRRIARKMSERKIPQEEKRTKPVPTFWLVIRKYGWGLCYTVNLNADGTLNTTEPLTLGWKKMSDPLEDNPVLVGDVGALFEGDPVENTRSIWKYKPSVDSNGKVTTTLNITELIKLHVDHDGVYVDHEGELRLVTHAWVHLEYFWGGIPNLKSISVQVQHQNKVVISSAGN